MILVKLMIVYGIKAFCLNKEKAGINGDLLDSMSNYLTNRKQMDVIPGAVSNWTFIKAGPFFLYFWKVTNWLVAH